MNQTALDFLIERYYSDILKYCTARLKPDLQGAEDCTQEVFLVFSKKINSLDISRDLHSWLYAVANHKIKAYKRRYPPMIDLEKIPEPSYEMNLDGSPLDMLPEDEQKLLAAYYTGEDKAKLAKRNNLSLRALYMKVARIKKRLHSNLDDSYN